MAVAEKGIDLWDFAAKAVTEAAGDREAAIDLLKGWSKKNEALRAAILEMTSLGENCRLLVRQYEHRQKSLQWNAAGGGGKSESGDIGDLVAGARLSLLNYTLPNGRPLGKAGIPDLDDAVRFHGASERAHARDRIWLDAIRAHVKKGQLVEDVLSDEALRELQVEAQAQAGPVESVEGPH